MDEIKDFKEKVPLMSRVDPELRKRARIYAIKHDITLSDYIESLLVADLDKKEREGELTGVEQGENS